MKTKTAFFTDYDEVERRIHAHWPENEYVQKFEVLANLEISNGLTVVWEIDGKLDGSGGDYAEDLDNFLESGDMFCMNGTRTLMNAMAHDGKLQKGTYVIDCSW